ncbi:MAG TPA: DUF983 domain-containing protein [Flavilitoribacter sp.]|nr:DUF983 domain-containing protein [Flavilitoribacter sp.]HMQ86354.1 DUF983 domain-containing protein [Flavilitoribacter sp.]
MAKKVNKSVAASIFNMTCPKCHQGDLFTTPTFSFSKPFDMHPKCEKCGEDFMPEPGFYYGAMFLSYIFTGFFCLGFVMFFHWGLGWSTGASFGLLLAVCALLFVAVFRLSRSLWIHIVVRFDPNKAAQVSKES